MHKLIYTFIQYNTFGKLYLNATIVLLQRNSTHTWLWRFRMWKVRPSPYGAVNPAGSKTSCCESFIFSFHFFFAFIFSSSLWSSHPVVFSCPFSVFIQFSPALIMVSVVLVLIETHLLWLSSCSFEFCNRVSALIWYSCFVQQDKRISFAQKFLSRDSAQLMEFLNMLHLQYQLCRRCFS